MIIVVVELKESFIYLGYQSLITWFTSIFLILWAAFYSVDNIFWCTRVFNFDEAHFICWVIIVACVFDILFRKSLPNPVSWSFSLIFTCKCFILLTLTFGSLINFELCVCVCVCVRMYESNFILLHADIQFSPQNFL